MLGVSLEIPEIAVRGFGESGPPPVGNPLMFFDGNAFDLISGQPLDLYN